MCYPLSWPRPRSAGTSEHLHGSRQEVGDKASRGGKRLKCLEKQRGLLEEIWSDDNKRVRGLILLNLLTVLMATNWVIVKDAESALDPMTFAALRFGIAAVGFLPFLRQGMSDEAVRNAGLELGCWSAAGYLTQAVGLMTSDASRASFLSALTVVLVPIFAGLSGRGVRPLTWVSALAAVLGVALLGGDSKAPDAGDVWNILSAVFFALQVFRTEVHSREVGTHVAKPLMAVIVTTTMAIAFAADAATHWQHIMSTSLPTLLQSWWADAPQLPMKELLYTGLLSTDLVLLIELVALSDVSSSEAAIIYTLEPVLGGLLGIVVLHEGSHWGPLGWAGATVIVSTSLITQLASNNDKGLGK